MSTIHEDFVQDLNKYFGTLCVDDHYVKPVAVEIKDDTCTPSLSFTQVFNALQYQRSRKRQPDGIPFWLWKENAAILTPVIKIIWNLSLSTQTWPNAWKEANVIPLPKVDTPVQTQEFRGGLASHL